MNMNLVKSWIYLILLYLVDAAAIVTPDLFQVSLLSSFSNFYTETEPYHMLCIVWKKNHKREIAKEHQSCKWLENNIQLFLQSCRKTE